MSAPATIGDYLRTYGQALGELVLARFPALHGPDDPVWPALQQLKRRPFPAQAMAVIGVVQRWQEARCAAVVAECGTGKTLISLGSVFTHSNARPFTCLAMAPPQLVEKWCREAILTLPGVRVFIIDGCRNGLASNGFAGVNEVRLRNGRIIREGLKTTLSSMRLAKGHRSAKARRPLFEATADALLFRHQSQETRGDERNNHQKAGRDRRLSQSIKNQDFTHFLVGRIKEYRSHMTKMSDKQRHKIEEMMLANPEKSANSKSFEAFLAEQGFRRSIRQFEVLVQLQDDGLVSCGTTLSAKLLGNRHLVDLAAMANRTIAG